MKERDSIDLIREKAFMGQDFLTWLWYKSDTNGNIVRLHNSQDAGVSFERFITLEGGEGDAQESVTCRGLRAELTEAKTALQSGKKITKAHIRLSVDDFQWKFTIDAATLDLSSLKVPKTVEPGAEDGDDLSFEGRVLERAYMLELAVESVDHLFQTFLLVRLDETRWKDEKQGIREWIFSSHTSHTSHH